MAAGGGQVGVVNKKNDATEVGGLRDWGEFRDSDDEEQVERVQR